MQCDITGTIAMNQRSTGRYGLDVFVRCQPVKPATPLGRFGGWKFFELTQMRDLSFISGGKQLAPAGQMEARPWQLRPINSWRSSATFPFYITHYFSLVVAPTFSALSNMSAIIDQSSPGHLSSHNRTEKGTHGFGKGFRSPPNGRDSIVP